MACAHPYLRTHKSFPGYLFPTPCGRCINCIIDSRSTIEDLCDEELYQRNFCASYLTVTYDDYHLDWRDDWHGHLVPSLNKLDATKFVKRIRKYMADRKINSPILQKDFRYIVAGEYGEDRNRPHLHFVFFGLDYRAAAKMFRECWKYGQQKLLPVKDGCCRYVADYLTKQVKMPENAYDLYERHNIERPFFHHSLALGKTLFLRQWDFIKSHDYYYKSRKNVLRPLPAYYMRKYCLARADSPLERARTDFMQQYPNKPFNFKVYNEFMHQNALAREQNLIHSLRSHGIPVNDDYLHPLPPKSYGCSCSVDDFKVEYVASVRDYNKKCTATTGRYISFDTIKAVFSDKDGNFSPSPLFPSYTSWIQAHLDMSKYGTLIPF